MFKKQSQYNILPDQRNKKSYSRQQSQVIQKDSYYDPKWSRILPYEEKLYNNIKDKHLTPKQCYLNKTQYYHSHNNQLINQHLSKANGETLNVKNYQSSKKNTGSSNSQIKKNQQLQRPHVLNKKHNEISKALNYETDLLHKYTFTQENQSKFNNYDQFEIIKKDYNKPPVPKIINCLNETASTTDTYYNKTTEEYKYKHSTQKTFGHQKQLSYHEISKKLLNTVKLQDFKLIKSIGKGKYGRVFMVKHKNLGFISALKIIKKQQIRQQKLVNQLIRELKIHAFLDHPNIISFYGNFQDAQNIYILLELGNEGQLYNKLRKKEKFCEQTTSFIIKNLLEAVKYMHSKKLIHRDIKPENIVIINGIVKLCDFGWSVYKGSQLRTTFCGTPIYISPQLLKGQSYDQKVDLWSIGILAYQLLIGEIPFSINTQQQLSKIIWQNIVFPQKISISDECKDFIKKILNKNPKLRGHASELLKHPFIERYSQFETCQQLCES